MRQARQAGFTLLELMITVAVIAILSAVAIPQFADYTKRGKIPEATATLSDLRLRAESYYANNRTYVPGAGVLDWTAVAAPRYFGFACVTAASTYTCTATGGTGPTDRSMLGFAYTVNQNNVKTSTITVSGWGNSATCWVTKKGETC